MCLNAPPTNVTHLSRTNTLPEPPRSSQRIPPLITYDVSATIALSDLSMETQGPLLEPARALCGTVPAQPSPARDHFWTQASTHDARSPPQHINPTPTIRRQLSQFSFEIFRPPGKRHRINPAPSPDPQRTLLSFSAISPPSLSPSVPTTSPPNQDCGARGPIAL